MIMNEWRDRFNDAVACVISIKLTFMAIFPAAQTIYFPRLVSYIALEDSITCGVISFGLWSIGEHGHPVRSRPQNHGVWLVWGDVCGRPHSVGGVGLSSSTSDR